jgi:myo-inositol catabolism protein IolC
MLKAIIVNQKLPNHVDPLPTGIAWPLDVVMKLLPHWHSDEAENYRALT